MSVERAKFFFWRACIGLALVWFAVGSQQKLMCFGDDSLTGSTRHEIILPKIPENDEGFVPRMLIDLSKVDRDAKQWQVALTNDVPGRPEFSLEIADRIKPRWKLYDSTGVVIAQAAVRDNQLFFVWHKENATAKNYSQLLNAKWVLKADHGRLYHCRARALDEAALKLNKDIPAIEKVLARHHGLDLSHTTPHEVTHGYHVPNIKRYDDLFFEVRSPFPHNVLMQSQEKKRRADLGRWIKFELDVNQWLKLSLKWMAETSDGSAEEGSDFNLLVHQEISYRVGGAKNLPASNAQIIGHRRTLMQKINEDTARKTFYTKQLEGLRARANQIRGAKRGTPEWSEQTVVGNQVRQGLVRIKAAVKRIRKNRRDLEAIAALEAAVLSLHDHPIAYRVATERFRFGKPRVLLESKGWGLTPEDCFPLLGEWTNEEQMDMEVKPGVISTKQADGNQISQPIYKVESITPCSTSYEAVLKYDRTGESVVVCYFTDGKHTIMRREFVFKNGNNDIAHETFYARISNVWTPHTRANIVTDDEEISIEVGELKSWEIANKYKWTRVKLQPQKNNAIP